MDKNLRFPLFEELMHGSLDPTLPAMAADTDYADRIEKQIVALETDTGRYLILFHKAHHAKQRYYQKLLNAETIAYCNEIITLLLEETSPHIRAYYRDCILDKHLTTCMKRLHEKMAAHDLNLPYRKMVEENANQETLCNKYVLEFLKVCLAKAYLEFQDCLEDVVRYKMTEQELYSTLMNELPPVRTYLNVRPEVQRILPVEKAPAPPVRSAEKAAAPSKNPSQKTQEILETYISVKDITEKTGLSAKTTTRYLTEGKLKGSKPGGKWIIAQRDFEEFYETHQNKKNQKPTP